MSSLSEPDIKVANPLQPLRSKVLLCRTTFKLQLITIENTRAEKFEMRIKSLNHTHA